MYIRYLHKLCDLHVECENYTEAAHTLLLYTKLLRVRLSVWVCLRVWWYQYIFVRFYTQTKLGLHEHISGYTYSFICYDFLINGSSAVIQWSDDPLGPLLRSDAYQQAQTHRELKDLLYHQIVENFDKGDVSNGSRYTVWWDICRVLLTVIWRDVIIICKFLSFRLYQMWEKGIELCKQLITQYEDEVFDYEQLRSMLVSNRFRSISMCKLYCLCCSKSILLFCFVKKVLWHLCAWWFTSFEVVFR